MSEPQVYVTETTPEPFLTITLSRSVAGSQSLRSLILSREEAVMVLEALTDKLNRAYE